MIQRFINWIKGDQPQCPMMYECGKNTGFLSCLKRKEHPGRHADINGNWDYAKPQKKQVVK